MAKATTIEKRLDSIEALLRHREPERELSAEGKEFIEVARLSATRPRAEDIEETVKVQPDEGRTEAPAAPPEPELERERFERELQRAAPPEVDLGTGHGSLSWGARTTSGPSEERAWASGLAYDVNDAFGRR